MNREVRCPHCNFSLQGRDKMYRSIVIEDSDWFGIVDGQVINCNITPSQPYHTDLCCMNCGNSIQRFIEDIIEDEVVEQGDLF